MLGHVDLLATKARTVNTHEAKAMVATVFLGLFGVPGLFGLFGLPGVDGESMSHRFGCLLEFGLVKVTDKLLHEWVT